MVVRHGTVLVEGDVDDAGLHTLVVRPDLIGKGHTPREREAQARRAELKRQAEERRAQDRLERRRAQWRARYYRRQGRPVPAATEAILRSTSWH